MCLPFIYLPDKNGKGKKDVEFMVEALGVLVWMVAREACPHKKLRLAARFSKLVRTPHKAEWKGDKDGLLWFNKACETSRMATTIVDTTEKKGKKKRWYAYLGGGAVDHNQSWLMQGLMILAKDWEWAACTIVALWLLSGCSDCGRPAWVDKRCLVTAGDAAAVEEPKDLIVTDMAEPEAGAEEEKSRAEGDEEKKAKSDDDAVSFRELCHSLAERVHASFADWPDLPEGWPYKLPEGDDLEALGKVPSHGPSRHVLAHAARTKFETWWGQTTAAVANEEEKKSEAEAAEEAEA